MSLLTIAGIITFTLCLRAWRQGLLVLRGPGLLAGCTRPGQVGLASHVNFAPPPATDPTPLLQESKAIAAALPRCRAGAWWLCPLPAARPNAL